MHLFSEGAPCDAEIAGATRKEGGRVSKVCRSATLARLFSSFSSDRLTDEPRPFSDARATEIVADTANHVSYTPLQSGLHTAYLLLLQIAGIGRVAHAGHETASEPGDLALLDTARPFDLTFPGYHHILVWELPRETLAPLLASPEEAAAARVSGRHGVGAVLADHARVLADRAEQLDARTWRSLWLHLCNLVALALRGALRRRPSPPRSTYRAARRQQILAYVEAHLCEESLSAKQAARDLGMSRRWLHALFDEAGMSFGAWVAQRRIEECRRLLEDPRHDDLPISQIAFQCGFNELSTFNRRFRAHFGTSPRVARKQAQSRRASMPA